MFKIEDCYVFPKDNSKRKFLLNWLNVYEWLVYSKKENGEYCKYCALFGNSEMKRNLINQAK